MPIPVVWSSETRRHEPLREVWVGVPTEGTEVPARVDRILDALPDHERVEATQHDDDVLHRVHDPALVEHLRTIHAEWMAGQLESEVKHGAWRVVPASADVVFSDKPTKLWEQLSTRADQVIADAHGEIPATRLSAAR